MSETLRCTRGKRIKAVFLGQKENVYFDFSLFNVGNRCLLVVSQESYKQYKVGGILLIVKL